VDTGAYSSWGCSACVMDFFGYVLRVLADDCTGGKRSGFGDVANEALNGLAHATSRCGHTGRF
jgi:hypothetical protein